MDIFHVHVMHYALFVFHNAPCTAMDLPRLLLLVLHKNHHKTDMSLKMCLMYFKLSNHYSGPIFKMNGWPRNQMVSGCMVYGSHILNIYHMDMDILIRNKQPTKRPVFPPPVLIISQAGPWGNNTVGSSPPPENRSMNNVDLKSADLSSSPKAEMNYVDLVRLHPHPHPAAKPPTRGQTLESVMNGELKKQGNY